MKSAFHKFTSVSINLQLICLLITITQAEYFFLALGFWKIGKSSKLFPLCRVTNSSIRYEVNDCSWNSYKKVGCKGVALITRTLVAQKYCILNPCSHEIKTFSTHPLVSSVFLTVILTNNYKLYMNIITNNIFNLLSNTILLHNE